MNSLNLLLTRHSEYERISYELNDFQRYVGLHFLDHSELLPNYNNADDVLRDLQDWQIFFYNVLNDMEKVAYLNMNRQRTLLDRIERLDLNDEVIGNTLTDSAEVGAVGVDSTAFGHMDNPYGTSTSTNRPTSTLTTRRATPSFIPAGAERDTELFRTLRATPLTDAERDRANRLRLAPTCKDTRICKLFPTFSICTSKSI